MTSLELFVATTSHFTFLPTVVAANNEGVWIVALEWTSFAIGVKVM